MALGIIVGVAVFLLWCLLYPKLVANQQKKNEETDQLWQEKRLSDDSIAETQAKFEQNIGKELIGVRHRDAYIYRLMSRWFAKLQAQQRYNSGTTEIWKKIKSDWLEYLWALEFTRTGDLGEAAYQVWRKREEIKKKTGMDAPPSEDEKEEAATARKIDMIEDSFAFSIGDDAVAELKRVRSMSSLQFDADGLHIAPEGHFFVGDMLIKSAKNA